MRLAAGYSTGRTWLRLHPPRARLYSWGELLMLSERGPDARFVNLETAVTPATRRTATYYRIHPDNLPCITCAGIDCCVLATTTSWTGDARGLSKRRRFQRRFAHGRRRPGAQEAGAPAAMELPAAGCSPLSLPMRRRPAARPAPGRRPAIAAASFLGELSGRIAELAASVRPHRRAGDVVDVSAWGDNWGSTSARGTGVCAWGSSMPAAPTSSRGHSSHHVKGIEVRRGKLISTGAAIS